MKKAVILSFVVALCLGIVMLLPSLGFGSSEVTSMTFQVDDGPVPPQYFSISNLEVVPDHEQKMIEAKYEIYYPERTEETDGEDLSTTAILGEEYYDKFMAMVVLMDEMTEYELENDQNYVGAGSLVITLFNERGEQAKLSTYWPDDEANITKFKDFYLELVNLLAGDVQV